MLQISAAVESRVFPAVQAHHRLEYLYASPVLAKRKPERFGFQVVRRAPTTALPGRGRFLASRVCNGKVAASAAISVQLFAGMLMRSFPSVAALRRERAI
jgi:hypothetical protein